MNTYDNRGDEQIALTARQIKLLMQTISNGHCGGGGGDHGDGGECKSNKTNKKMVRFVQNRLETKCKQQSTNGKGERDPLAQCNNGQVVMMFIPFITNNCIH